MAVPQCTKLTSVPNLINDLQNERAQIPTETLQNLVESLPRRVEAVIAVFKCTVIKVPVGVMNNEALQMLLAQQHRLRYSDSVERGAFVFPLSGTAFMLITPEEFLEKAENAELFDRIEKFVQVHRNSFLLLQSPVYSMREWEIVSTVQKRCIKPLDYPQSQHIKLFGSNLKILPVHCNADVVKAVLTIAKATTKPHVDSIRDRMTLARSRIIESSPVWELLGDLQLKLLHQPE